MGQKFVLGNAVRAREGAQRNQDLEPVRITCRDLHTDFPQDFQSLPRLRRVRLAPSPAASSAESRAAKLLARVLSLSRIANMVHAACERWHNCRSSQVQLTYRSQSDSELQLLGAVGYYGARTSGSM